MASYAENASIWWRHHDMDVTGGTFGAISDYNGGINTTHWYQRWQSWRHDDS